MNKTQTQTVRIIEVEHCGVGYCPYCIPDSSRKSINYCGAFDAPQEIESRVKTFPKICPLKTVQKI
jgi:hypothetical protein